MKSKDSPNIYEILRSAARPSGGAAPSTPEPGAEAAPPSLQDRLAAYKSAKVALAPAPEAAVSAAGGPGERSVRVTYNTLVFSVLVTIGFAFVSYSLGVRSGRSQAAAEVPVASAQGGVIVTSTPPAPTPPPGPPKTYSINLVEYAGTTGQERQRARLQVDTLIRALDRASFKGAEMVDIKRGANQRVALYFGKFTDLGSVEAKAKLASLRAFRHQNQELFAQAFFEEAPQSRAGESGR